MYIPHTEEDIREMLQRIGLETVEDLFRSVPEGLKFQGLMNLPAPLPQAGLRRVFADLAEENASAREWLHFLGGGAYDHFIPAPIWHLLERSEFYSAYTPYQPEISQGTLQAVFEFQTLICQMTGMEVANASMYDGATSAAEAVLMAARITGKDKALLSEAIHPQYRSVIETYCRHSPVRLETVPVSPAGVTSGPEAGAYAQDDVACLAVQSPNFLGCVEPVRSLKARMPGTGGLLIQIVAEPLSLGVLQSPGALGADLAVGECQSLGIPLQYGGPFAGFFATRKAHVRNMPGRIVGETRDMHGRRGYVLTLATREQHIRRGRATSNICTNHNLCALAATFYMALLGKSGMKEVALMNLAKAEYAKSRLAGIRGVHLPHTAPTFNEFVVQLPRSPGKVLKGLREREQIVAGIPLEKTCPQWENALLVCVTEMRTREEIDRFAAALERECRIP